MGAEGSRVSRLRADHSMSQSLTSEEGEFLTLSCPSLPSEKQENNVPEQAGLHLIKPHLLLQPQELTPEF